MREIFKIFADEYHDGTYWLRCLYWVLIALNIYGLASMFIFPT